MEILVNKRLLLRKTIEPAQIQPAEDVNKVERRLKTEEKKALPKSSKSKGKTN